MAVWAWSMDGFETGLKRALKREYGLMTFSYSLYSSVYPFSLICRLFFKACPVLLLQNCHAL